MDRKFIDSTREKHVLTLVLNDPKTKNAMTLGLVSELRAALDAARDDRSIRAIVLRGANGAFCAGADLKSALADLSSPATGDETDPVYRANREGGALFAEIDGMPQTVIAAVEGPAFGGGFGMVCCADVVLCTPSARFSLSETRLGLPPAQIAPYVVGRLGLARARRLGLTATRFDGREAVEVGLADKIFEDRAALDAALRDILNDIGGCAPGALAITKTLFKDAARSAPAEMLDRAARAFTDCLRGAEGREGVAAFNEKRPAAWVERLE